MNLHRPLLVASILGVMALSAMPVAPALAADNLGGEPVPGVCLLSRQAVFAQAKVGVAASQRLVQLEQQARTQLASARAPLDADVQSFREKSASLSDAVRKQQASTLQQRVQAFQKQASELNERMQVTRAKAMQQIGQDAEPIVSASYKSRHCGLLLDRDSVLAGNMSNDLTADVVAGLDRKITTISLNLEPLPTPAATPGSAVKK